MQRKILISSISSQVLRQYSTDIQLNICLLAPLYWVQCLTSLVASQILAMGELYTRSDLYPLILPIFGQFQHVSCVIYQLLRIFQCYSTALFLQQFDQLPFLMV